MQHGAPEAGTRPKGIGGSIFRNAWDWILAAPAIGAIVFVAVFSSAFPLTDEWFFTDAIVALQRVDLHTSAGWSAAFDLLPTRFNGHCVSVPFLLYWPIAEWTHLDSRWQICVTLACFAVELLIFRRYLVKSSLWAAPIALLLFCPSHYMDFLWGWQINFSLSMAFALSGLVAIDRFSSATTKRADAGWLLLGMFLFLLGTLSSAGGFFGFPCALLLVALKRSSWRDKLVPLGVLAIGTAITFVGLMYSPEIHLEPGVRVVACVLTALGGTIWGTEVGPIDLGVDLLSTTGLVIALCIAAVVARAMFVGALPRMALALSVTAFGLLCITSVAMAREGLGNWHLQYMLMTPCGGYVAAWLLCQEDKSRFARVPFIALCIVMLACVITYARGFSKYGPNYEAYAIEIETYARTVLVDPSATKIHPPPMDVNLPMLLFLSAHDHPLFPRERGTASALPPEARVFVDLEQAKEPLSVTVQRGTLQRLTVVISDQARAGSVRAQIGAETLVLRRIHPAFSRIAAAHEPGMVCYSGLLVPSLLPQGEQQVTLSMLR